MLNSVHKFSLELRAAAVYIPVSCLRLESQMTSDIKAILCLLQRSSSAGPPAYSAVTASLEKQAISTQSAVNTSQSLTLAPQVTLHLHPPLQNTHMLNQEKHKLCLP